MTSMKTCFMSDTGVAVLALAFGTMRFGGDADEAESARLYARCRDAGITLFDCADAYAGGHCKEILGRLSRPPATKSSSLVRPPSRPDAATTIAAPAAIRPKWSSY
jgi:aryl-alcohol dehydrogenase-like predicted oxidoreductase